MRIAVSARAPAASARCERRLEIVDHQVEMDRGPVPVVAAKVIAGADRTGGFLQQIDRHRPAAELGRFRAEPPGHGQAEGGGVERHRGGQVGDVDVDQQVHGISVT